MNGGTETPHYICAYCHKPAQPKVWSNDDHINDNPDQAG
jgi:hypothetical protein